MQLRDASPGITCPVGDAWTTPNTAPCDDCEQASELFKFGRTANISPFLWGARNSVAWLRHNPQGIGGSRIAMPTKRAMQFRGTARCFSLVQGRKHMRHALLQMLGRSENLGEVQVCHPVDHVRQYRISETIVTLSDQAP